jgi:hypothetical protein
VSWKFAAFLLLAFFFILNDIKILSYFFKNIKMLELIIINYNMYDLICNKYILYDGLSNYIRNEVIKFCIEFIICHEKLAL